MMACFKVASKYSDRKYTRRYLQHLSVCIATVVSVAACSQSSDILDIESVEKKKVLAQGSSFSGESTNEAADLSTAGLESESEADSQASLDKASNSGKGINAIDIEKLSELPMATMATLLPEVGSDQVVEIEFSVQNATGRAVKLLPWGTPMESRLSGPSFRVTRLEPDGQSIDVPYLGMMIRRAAPKESDYILLPPGETLTNKLKLDDAYSLSTPGSYTIEYAPFDISADGVFAMGDTLVLMRTPKISIVRLN